MDPIFFALARAGETIQRSANGHCHGAGATDAGTCGSFGIGGECEPTCGPEKLYDFRQQREAVPSSFRESGERTESFFAPGVAGNKFYLFAALVGFDEARGISRDGDVDGERAGMEKIKRPDIKSCACEIDACRRLGLNNHGRP